MIKIFLIGIELTKLNEEKSNHIRKVRINNDNLYHTLIFTISTLSLILDPLHIKQVFIVILIGLL
jgi:hypothetical protein